MFIEAIIPCVGFGDKLWDTLPRNISLFDRVTVVTDKEDRETQSATIANGAELLTTDAHRRNGSKYDRGAAINTGLVYASRKDWLCVLDCDIVLPPISRKLIERIEPDRKCIYGVDRIDVPGWIQYAAWLTNTGANPNSSSFLNVPAGWKIGSRVSLTFCDGWTPCGYFQLWHSSEWETYPDLVGANAEATDLLHGQRWPRNRRVLIPDFFALHLIAAHSNMGADWQGRTTPRWGPPDIRARQPAVEPGDGMPKPSENGRAPSPATEPAPAH